MTKYVLVDLDKIALTNQFTQIGSRLGYSILEVSEMDYDLHFTSVKHLILEREEAVKGNKYWGEVRDRQSGYSIVDGLTVKTKVAVSEEGLNVAVNFMKKVALFALTDIIDTRYNKIQSKYSNFEIFTWNIQVEEATKYLADNGAPTPLLKSLADSRGISVDELANKVVSKSTTFRDEISSLLITQQTINKKIEQCSTIRDMNKFFEDYFGIEMPRQQASEEGLTDENGERTHTIDYGIKF
jgi:antitoxin component HigA of HigAB toxin-antitoxin module